MKSIPILLFGCGGVGRQLLQHIIHCRSLHCNQGIILRVFGVADGHNLLLVQDFGSPNAAFDDKFLDEICAVKSQGLPLSSLLDRGRCQVFNGSEVTSKVADIANLLGKSTRLVGVDCSASSETGNILKQIIGLHGSVVLANKKPLTSTIEDYDRLISNFRCIRFESTVGAGLPVIASINRVIASGDPIYRIVGSLSGTLGYVMTRIEEGKLFSEAVLSAKSLGYTEPDPRDDLSGMDVARKGLILSRLMGWRLNMSDIKVESLSPDDLGPNSMSTDEFLKNGLPSLDGNISERARLASSKGKVLRYVCMIEGSSCQVGLQELAKDSPLGRLKGTDNIVEIYTRCYENSPLVIQGAGAGNDTTAAGVLADIVDLQDLFH